MKLIISLLLVTSFYCRSEAFFKNSISCKSNSTLHLVNNKRKVASVGKSFSIKSQKDSNAILIGKQNAPELKILPWFGIDVISNKKSVILGKIVTDNFLELKWKKSRKSKQVNFIKCEKT